MGRVKIKKKSTFIDMTAMSDVTVLLLTFFMLTSTFVKPEPVKVNVPGSVSEIKAMGQEYGVQFSAEETKKFMVASTFGVPMKNMKAFLAQPEEKQTELLKSPDAGIPTDSLNNEFKAWMRNARAINKDLRIAIKADATTPYSTIKDVMNSLQDLHENRYNLITTLKTTSEE